ncbi:radical SAM protein, partial [bacterium]|nr:radical SAM protein [bacterium]
EKFRFPFETFRYKFKLKENYNFWIHLHVLFKTLTKSPRKKKFSLGFTKMEGYKEANRKLSDAEYKNMKLYLVSNPVGLSICLTGKCNLNCGKCVRNTPFAIKQRPSWEKDITAENLEKLRTFFPGLYGVRFTSAFGEPLLYSGFKDIVKELFDYGVRVGTFNTNGILLSKEMSHFLVQNPMVNCFAISLDAATEETFRKLQGKPFNRIIENIKYYMSISNNYPNLNLYFIVSKSNIHEICDYIKMAHELGVQNVLMDYLNYGPEYFKINIQVTEGNLFNYKDEFVGNMDLSKIREKAMKLGEKFGIKLMGNFFQEYYQEEGTSKDDIPLCSLPWRNLSIETDGGVRNCCWQNENLTNINECETIDQLWNNEKQIRVRKGIKNNKLDDICYSSTCPVVSSGVKINWLFQ